MSELSDAEIAEAAAEAGISPAELRAALAEQSPSGALASQRTGGTGGTVAAPVRGTTVAHSETRLPYAPEQAVRTVKRKIEEEIGSTGHMMGSTAADIYDEPAGIVYRLQAEGDGIGGAIVRVDIDPTPMRSRRTLTSMGLGATVGLFAITGLIVPGLIGWALLASAVGLTALGAGTMAAVRSRVVKDAQAITAHALVEAEHGVPIGGDQLGPAGYDVGGPRALPPADPNW